jgi:tetratricopeptide (TPR) repeat protein
MKSFFLTLLLIISLLLPSLSLPLPAHSAESQAHSQAELRQIYKDLERIFTQAFSATQSGDFVTAERYWSEAIDLYPNNPAAWSNRGNSRVSQFKLEAAIEDFDQAIDLVPYLADPYINRGTAWEGLGEWDKAIADYDRAIELAPQDPVAYNNRGNAKGSAGDWSGAAADFYEAVTLAPGLAVASVNYALALYQLGDVQESTRWLKNLVRKYAAFADPRAALTAVLWGQGRQGEAESNWYPVIGLDSRYRDLDWLREIRRWPPTVINDLEHFLTLR